jgi:hypothetical protein
VSTIVVAGLTRGCKELGKDFGFFKIIGILFDSVFYSLAVNTILQPFLRNFMNFTKSFYSDEAYLTHTLPVNKKQLINSKYITAIIEITLGFVSLIISLIIMFASPTFFDTLAIILSTIVSGKIAGWLALTLFITLVVVEFLMFISIIFFSIVFSYKSKEKRVLRTFLTTALLSFVSMTVLSIVMVVVLLINGVELSSSTLVLSSSAFISIILTGIVVYIIVAIVFYFLAKREFNKGVNID